MDLRSMIAGLAFLLVGISVTSCVSESPVRSYFATAGYTYPLHVSLPTRGEPKVVCPGCPEPRRLTPEFQQVLVKGRRFLRTRLSVEFLRSLTGPEDEAFLVSGAFLFEDSPGGPIQLAVNLSTFKSGTIEDREIHIPHQRHSTAVGDVLELRNVLLLRPTRDNWEYTGWAY